MSKDEILNSLNSKRS